ncbi:MAG: hypothetical protein K6G40_06635 [Eubacterium sp.]|nr:hypothetical protein [Eubacterium sp.]
MIFKKLTKTGELIDDSGVKEKYVRAVDFVFISVSVCLIIALTVLSVLAIIF